MTTMSSTDPEYPPNIKVIKSLNELWRDAVYQLTDESHDLFTEPWYFTVSVSSYANSTAVFVCTEDGKYSYDNLTPKSDAMTGTGAYRKRLHRTVWSESESESESESGFECEPVSVRKTKDSLKRLEPIAMALRTVYPETQIWSDGRICIYTMEHTYEDVAVWDIAGPEYQRYRSLVRDGTYIERKLVELYDALNDPETTKDQAREIFKKLFMTKVEKYLDFRDLGKVSKS